MSDYIDLKAQNYSFLGKECHLKGEFTLTGPTAIQAKIVGEIHMANTLSPLSLERGGVIEGDLYCHDFQIQGQFRGKIRASGKVTIHPSASVQADIQAKSLEIHPGAEVDMSGETLEDSQT